LAGTETELAHIFESNYMHRCRFTVAGVLTHDFYSDTTGTFDRLVFYVTLHSNTLAN